MPLFGMNLNPEKTKRIGIKLVNSEKKPPLSGMALKSQKIKKLILNYHFFAGSIIFENSCGD